MSNQKIKNSKVKEKKAELKEEKESAAAKLKPTQKLFCELYVSKHFGNGVQAYAEAYGIDFEKTPQRYNSARAMSCELLTNINILSYIREIMPEVDLNELTVDKELMFTILQNADFGSKVAAIREYNKLKNRITEKITHGLDESLSEVSITIKRK